MVTVTIRRLRQTLRTCRRARRSALALGVLLGYLLVGQVVAPGFTDYWGFQVFRAAATLLLAVGLEALFAEEGGLSWQTHVIGVASAYADTLGTAGHMYETFGTYDKLTHFASFAAITAVVYDCLAALVRRAMIHAPRTRRLLIAIAAGIVAGIAWEVLEYVGETEFHTARLGGFWDTTTDLIADGIGAVMLGLMLWDREGKAPADQVVPYHGKASGVRR